MTLAGTKRAPWVSRREALAGGAVLLLSAAAIRSGIGHGPRRPTPPPPRPARPSTLEALGDLAEGVPLGPFQISGVTDPTEGAVLVHASSPAGEVTYEVRLASDAPLPAAKGGRYAVYFRAAEGGSDVLAGAVALRRLLQRAPSSGPPLAGLTPYPAPHPP